VNVAYFPKQIEKDYQFTDQINNTSKIEELSNLDDQNLQLNLKRYSI